MITIHAKEFSAALKAASMALPSSPLIPIMAYVLVELGQITAIGTEMSIQIATNAEGDESVCVHPGIVQSIVDSLDEPITITRGRVSWSTGHVDFPPTDGYPEFVRGNAKRCGTIQGGRYSTILKSGLPVVVEVDMDAKRLVWTDFAAGQVYFGGHQAFQAYDIEPGGKGNFGMSKSVASKVAGLLSSCEEVGVSESDNQVYFNSPGLNLAITKMTDSLPAYARILAKIAESGYKRTDISIPDLNRIVKSIRGAFGESIINVTCAQGMCVVTFTDYNGGKGMSQNIPSGDYLSFHANTKYLARNLEVCDTLLFLESESAIYFTGPGVRGLTMPIKML